MESIPFSTISQPGQISSLKQNQSFLNESRYAPESVSPEASIPSITSLSDLATATGKGGGALRSIDQNFQVNPANGTLSISIPLQVTASRNNFNPVLGLVYDSGSGNGCFGMGWTLSTESISRRTSKNIPTYDADDVFMLSGSDDLVPVERSAELDKVRDGYYIQQFRPRVENEVTLIEQWTSQARPDDTFWRTISPDNVTKVFGRTDSSRVFELTPSSKRRIFSWLICESYDALGNAMLFSYKSENLQGVLDQPLATEKLETGKEANAYHRARYLKSIKYGNKRASRDDATWAILQPSTTDGWMFEVVLDYGEHSDSPPTSSPQKPWVPRLDPFSRCSSGFEIRQYRLCRRMLMFHNFQKELGINDFLVSSIQFQYEESPTGSLLQSITRLGHMLDSTGNFRSQKLPSSIFEYNEPAALSASKVEKMKPASIQMIPSPRRESKLQWIDLNGEGTPGLLVQMERSWYYQRNKNASLPEQENGEAVAADIERFGPVKLLELIPNVYGQDTFSFEDLDGSGLQSLVTIDQNGHLDGYYECLGEDQWHTHNSFPRIPSMSMNQNDVLKLDLTGNGVSDVLVNGGEDEGLKWHRSLGRRGFGCEQRVSMTGSFPRVSHDDLSQALFQADMNGDGLTDMVHVTSQQISYWQNLGYAHFSSEVIMSNAPCLEDHGDFDINRVHFLDTDGSGTADLVYLLPSGGAMVYTNQCGNGWSKGKVIESVPQIQDPGSVFTLDLLGRGTSCLCWIAPDGSHDDLAIYYVSMSPGPKPYLLRSLSNGIGLVSTVSYSPSTKFYHQDEREGRPWKTKLPFPVHTVRRVVERDDVSLATRTTNYRYHDGYFDTFEKEFRGFGMVEKWEDEKLQLGSGQVYQKPTRYTKMWFHNGVPESIFNLEGTFSKPKLSTKLPFGLSANEIREVCRALKGNQVRTEVYGIDGSVNSSIPYTVSESNYEARVVRKSVDQKHPAICRTYIQESLTINYERAFSEPRLEHSIILERNEFGDVKRSLSVRYGRKKSGGLGVRTDAAQSFNDVVLTEVDYTKTLPLSDAFYKPATAARRYYHIFGLDTDDILSSEAMKAQNFSDFSLKSTMDDIKREDGSTHGVGEKQRVLDGETRIFYRSRDMASRLGHGVFEPYSMVDQSYELILTKQLREAAYGPDQEKIFNQPSKDLLVTSALVDLDKDGSWWAPSPRLRFVAQGKEQSELSTARKSFYVPNLCIDPFGNQSSTQMDKYFLLPEQAIDAYGNTINATNDYRVMQAVQVTDPNLNRTQVAIDALGDAIAIARMGKAEETVGDALTNFDTILSTDSVRAFIENPSQSLARGLLGDAGSRSIKVTERLKLEGSDQPLPAFRISLGRAKHANSSGTFGKFSSDEISISITYLDGRGFPTQAMTLSKQKGLVYEWCCGGCTINDASGTAVKTSQAFFSANHLYMSVTDITVPAWITLNDAVERSVVKLNPDHTWSKAILSSWSSVTWNEGNTVSILDPRLDHDVGHHFARLKSSNFLPSWAEGRLSGSPLDKDAAQKSTCYADNTTTIHFDSCSRPVLTLEGAGTKQRSTLFGYDIRGNRIEEVDSASRIVEQCQYNLRGQKTRVKNMDTGGHLFLQDCTGKDLVAQNINAGCTIRNVYDGLRRVVETRVVDRIHHGEFIWSKIVFGEKVSEGEKRNLKGRVSCVFDQSGVRNMSSYDFKGNCLATTFQPATEYKTSLDWTIDAGLESSTYTTNTAFDALDRPYLSMDPLCRITKREYNLLGGLNTLASSTSVTNLASIGQADIRWDSYITQTSYTADGKPDKIDYGNKSHTEYAYDAFTRRVSKKKTWRDDGKVLEGLEYSYDCLGRAAYITDTAQQDMFFRNQKISSDRDYTYDAFGRLAKASGREMIDAATGSSRSLGRVDASSNLAFSSSNDLPANGAQLARYVESYKYDDGDNIIELRHEFSDATISGKTRSYYYLEPSQIEQTKKGNRLSMTGLGDTIESYSYDGNSSGSTGCISSVPGYSNFGWDCFSRLVSSSTQKMQNGTPEKTWYVYNNDGRRVRKVTEKSSTEITGVSDRKLKETLYLDSSEIHTTFSGQANGSVPKDEKRTSHIFAESKGSPVVTIENNVVPDGKKSADLVRYCISQSLEVDDEARIVSYEEYTPFGSSTLLTCGKGIEAPSRYRFASYTRDTETGLFHCGARYYCPWLGRWLSPDPLSTSDGLNIFAYVGNDPVNKADTSGTMKRSVQVPTLPEQVEKQYKGKIIAEFERMVAEHEVANQEESNVTTEAENAQLKESIATTQAENAQLKASNATTQAENEQLKEQNKHLEESGAEKQAENEKLTEEIRQLKAQLNGKGASKSLLVRGLGAIGRFVAHPMVATAVTTMAATALEEYVVKPQVEEHVGADAHQKVQDFESNHPFVIATGKILAAWTMYGIGLAAKKLWKGCTEERDQQPRAARVVPEPHNGVPGTGASQSGGSGGTGPANPPVSNVNPSTAIQILDPATSHVLRRGV